MLEFTKYLKENFNEDVSASEKIIKERWDKVVSIVREAFDDDYSDKKTALHRIQNEFVDERIAPSTIDVEFLKNNMDYVVEKVNSLDEGEIRITINNDVDKNRSSGLGMESTGKKRGRPRKDVVEEETEEPEEEKIVKVSVEGMKVMVEPSDGTGLEKSEHEFDSEEELKAFTDSLETLFKGFTVQMEEPEEGGEAEEEMYPESKSIREAEEEEPEDAGEEPEDAGEEPEDAGEESEDAGEEPEDADAINWEDIADLGGDDEEAEEEMTMRKRGYAGSSMYDLESLDLNKLVGKLVKVNEDWYNVVSVTKDKEIVGVDINKKKSKFTIDEVEEMEYDAEEECGMKYSEEEMGCPLKNGQEVLYKGMPCMVAGFEGDIAYVTDQDGEEYEAPIEQLEVIGPGTSEEEMEYAEEEMEYAEEEMEDDGGLEDVMAKVRDGENLSEPERDIIAGAIAAAKEGKSDTAVLDNVMDKLHSGERLSDEEIDVIHAAISVAIDGEEEMDYQSKFKSQWKDALKRNKSRSEDDYSSKFKSQWKNALNRSEEEMEEMAEEGLSFAKLANRYMEMDEEEIYNASDHSADGFTSNPSKPKEKIEKVPSAPKSPSKPAPSGNYTKSPSKPKHKMEPAGKVPKSDKKAAPSGNYTKSPSKPKEKIEKVPSPQIPSEYKKGGARG